MAKGRYAYDYPRPMVTVDNVVFAVRDGRLHVLLIKRKHEPYAGCWALPGGFIEMDEPLEAAAARELREEAGLQDIALEQIGAFGDPNRDPRGRTISIAYAGIVDWRDHTLQANDDAADVSWLLVDELPPLAFDHHQIVECALQTLRKEPRYAKLLETFAKPTVSIGKGDACSHDTGAWGNR